MKYVENGFCADKNKSCLLYHAAEPFATGIIQNALGLTLFSETESVLFICFSRRSGRRLYDSLECSE